VGDGSTTFNVPDLNNANSFPRGGGVLGVTGGATTTVHNHAFTTTHSHDLQNHIHGSAAHSHSLSDSGGAAAIPTLLNTIIYRANTLSSWTATDHVAISGAPVGDTSGNTGGIALRGSTDSTTPGNTGTPSTNSTSSISPGTSDNQTVSTLPPYLNVNFIIKI
jgi:microcystin-dependent protein